MEIHSRYYGETASNNSSQSDKLFEMIKGDRIKDLLTYFQSLPRDRLSSLVNERNNKFFDMLPLNYAIRCSSNHLILIMLLKLGARFDGSTESPLFMAVRGGLMNLFKVLVAVGANVNALDRDGYSLLHWACYKKNILMARLVLKQPTFIFHNHDRNVKRISPLGK